MFEKRKHVDYVEQQGERTNGTTILGALLLAAGVAVVAYGMGSNKGFNAGYNAGQQRLESGNNKTNINITE